MKTLKTYAPNELIKQVIEPPVVASSTLPKWYKDIPRTSGSENIIVSNGGNNLTVKACVPYLEAMSSGYMVKLWCDVQVTKGAEGPILNWTSDLAPITFRPTDSHTGLQQLENYSKYSYAWNMPWGVKPPKGYSLLITQPLNRPDLPFNVVSGIVDADNYAVPGIATFCISNSFEGFIKEGTPILQLIPIKRDKWSLQIDDNLTPIEESKRLWVKGIASGGAYKKKFWVKKEYN